MTARRRPPEEGSPTDAVSLARALVRCPSVTPEDAGALDVLEAALRPLGFACQRLDFAEGEGESVGNLYARLGEASPNLCFAGHTDVVPAGEEGNWSADPFGAELRDGLLYGRGASDMKGAIACFVAAAARFLSERQGRLQGSISLLITGNEEGDAINGTAKVLEWLEESGERLDACIVGEPTNPKRLGETIKIGRRGSMNCWLEVHGVQGHTAYPDLADNPVHRITHMLGALVGRPLDEGSSHFGPSRAQITSVDVGNAAVNMIPARARAAFNIRFNDLHTGAGVERWLRNTFDSLGGRYELEIAVSGEAFLTAPGPFTDLVATAVRRVTGIAPELGTGGGTSDARFIRNHCPVAEFGLVSETMHQVDERASLSDLETLTKVYLALLEAYFAD